MTISDTSPERRNLLLISFAFILFYTAGGKLADDTFRIMVINVSFAKPHVLKYFAWAMLMWFCLRFWQKSGFKFWSSLKSEIVSTRVPVSLENYAKSSARAQLVGAHASDHSTKRIVVENFVIESYRYYVLCNFMNGPGTVVHQELVKLNGIKALCILSDQWCSTPSRATHSLKS